ncbi:phosphate-starvation-inducible PsiE family protein [Halomonas denitrificans]|nr:phosphate-starvation-inducible PsiE family protein [Halomonas denitrificans]
MSAEQEQTPAAGDLAANAAADRVAMAGFGYIEKGLLIVTALMTLGAAGIEILRVVELRDITLADILLMFLYTEVLAMIAVFYTGVGSPFMYPIFIAITALSRLIVLQGKDMAPQAVLYEAAAILLLAGAALIMLRIRVNRKGEIQAGG